MSSSSRSPCCSSWFCHSYTPGPLRKFSKTILNVFSAFLVAVGVVLLAFFFWILSANSWCYDISCGGGDFVNLSDTLTLPIYTIWACLGAAVLCFIAASVGELKEIFLLFQETFCFCF